MNKKNNQQRNNKKTKLALFWWSIGGVITIALLISAAVAFPLNFETSLVVSSSSQQSNTSSSEVTTTSLSLVGIEVDKLPSKLTYSAIDTIETSGGILRLIFSDYSVRYVSINDNMIDTTRLNTSAVGSSRVTLSYSFNGDTLFTSYNVNIVPFVINPTSLSLDIASSDVLLDQVVNLNYIIQPSNASYSSVVWSSSNPLIATVDNNGLVTPKNVGEVVITVTVDNNLSAVSRINVISEKNLPSETSAPQPEQPPQDPVYTSTLLILDQPDNYSFSDELDYIDFDFSTNLSILTAGNLKSRYDVNPININSNLFKGVVYTFSATAGASYQVNTTSQNSDTLIFVFSAPILDILSDLVDYDLDSSFLFFNDNKANGNTNSSVTFTSNISQNYEFLVLSKDNLGSGSILVSQFSTFDGYFLSNDISKPLTTLNLPIPSGTSQVNALSVLPTIVYEKDINGLFSPINLGWGLAGGVTYSSVAGATNGVLGSISNTITIGNNISSINGNLNIMPVNAIPISSATQLSQIKPYSTTTTVTFGEGIYSTTETFNSGASPMGRDYYLINDIDLSTFNDGVWIPIGYHTNLTDLFTGKLNGNNFTIYNFNEVTNTRYIGLFGNIRGATISNLLLYGNLLLNKTIQTSIAETGGLVSNNFGNRTSSSPLSYINNVHSFVNIESDSNNPIGGLLGVNSDDGRIEITNSSNNGNIKLVISSNNRTGIGGIVGKSTGQSHRAIVNILRSFNTGTITTAALAAGGLIGEANTSNFTIEDSYNIGEIYAAGEAGGIIGMNTNSTGTMFSRRNYNLGKITRLSGNSTKFGSIVGSNFSSALSTAFTYSLQNLVDYEGSLSNGNGLSVDLYKTLEELKSQINYDSTYLFGSSSTWLINEGNTTAYINNSPEVLNVSLAELIESNATSGQISNNVFNITLSNTSRYFESTITTADVSSLNLPDGLTFSVTYIQFNTIRITISGTALNHTANNSLANLNFVIDSNKINGANQNYTTRGIRIKFIDAAPVV